MELRVDAFAVSPRRDLRPGMSFRVRRGSGPYLVTTGEPTGAEPGEYRALRVWRDTRRPKRLYCDAVHCGSGRTHTLYIAGPAYRCHLLPDLLIRPYAVKLLEPPPERSAKAPRRRELAAAH